MALDGSVYNVPDLLTTLPDAQRYPAEELVLLYHEWREIELVCAE